MKTEQPYFPAERFVLTSNLTTSTRRSDGTKATGSSLKIVSFYSSVYSGYI
ncbi:MAG: hypothetical protein ACKVOW_08935 [Chitinophagaceae bacterium]